MAKTKCKVVVRKVVYEEVKSCPFPSNISLRELARQTGFDVGFLSRVRRGLVPISEEGWEKLEKAIAEVSV